jgi:diguanylate cyclase (GGDEF)-like protein
MAAGSVTVLVIAAGSAGLLQPLEWATLDLFFRLRPLEPPDPRIAIVTIGESDIKKVGQWPIPDAVLAKLIEKLEAHHPRAIGLALYRDLPVAPGNQALEEVFRSTPNLIGVEKAVGETVAPPATLSKLDRVGIADLLLDADGKVRRGLLSVRNQGGQTKLSLGVRLALTYLQAEGVSLQMIDAKKKHLQLGKAVFVPFRGNDGGYAGANAGGYQILLNFRGGEDNFATLSMTDVLENRIPPEKVRDRILIVGAAAPSLNDVFLTPYSSSFKGAPVPTPSAVIHANLTSQILSAALDGRPFIRVWDEPVEALWIFLWSVAGAAAGVQECLFVAACPLEKHSFLTWAIQAFCTVLAGGALLISCYLAFLGSWWVPAAAPLLALTGSAIASSAYCSRKWQRLALVDGLTLVANRRHFQESLEREWYGTLAKKRHLSLILCDIDCFKSYNDSWGHQAGDACLQQVAKAIAEAVRPTDVVARYGGEEFAVILPNTSPEIALQVADKIRKKVNNLKIDHPQSIAGQYVTVSCGVASAVADCKAAPADLISAADRGLYEAKERGRNRVILQELEISKINFPGHPYN